MEATVQSLTDVSREVQISATQEELTPHFEKAYQEYRKKIEIRGFRKGKAPLDLVKKLYADLIENESLNTVATEFYRQTVKDKDLKPIGEPVLIDMDYKRGERFVCKIQYDVRPVIQLKDYKGIAVDKVVHTVTEQEIEMELTRLRRSNAVLTEVDAVTDPEHIVTADLQDIDESGTPLIGKKSENIRFYLGDEQLEPPFKDALKEAKKGSAYPVTFEHQHEEHAHTVHTLVSVRKVEKVKLPTLDDAFAAKITKDKVKTVEALRAGIKDDIIAYWKHKSEREVINAISAEIIRRHDFQVPESLVRSVLDGLVEEMKNEYPGKKLPAEFDFEKFSEENRAYAVYQAKWALLRE